MQGNRRVIRWTHLHPRTSTKPIDLAEYLDSQERSLLIDADRLTPEYIAWHRKMRNKAKYHKP